MNSMRVIHIDDVINYCIYCPRCGFEYKTFDDTHFCTKRGAVFNIDDEVVINE
jgi:rRNA maturation endonuclease Nob1